MHFNRLEPVGDLERIQVLNRDKYVGLLFFPTDSYHESWDELVDLLIKTPTPPGLPEPE